MKTSKPKNSTNSSNASEIRENLKKETASKDTKVRTDGKNSVLSTKK